MRRTDAEAEALILWPPDVKSWLIRKDPDAGKDGWMASLMQQTWVSASSGTWWRTGKHGVQQSTGSHGVTKSQTRLSDWTATANLFFCEITFALCFCCSVAQSCSTLCDPMDCSTPGFPVLHCLLEFAQTHVHWVNDAIQLSYPLTPSSPGLNLYQYQDLFQWVGSSH